MQSMTNERTRYVVYCDLPLSSEAGVPIKSLSFQQQLTNSLFAQVVLCQLFSTCYKHMNVKSESYFISKTYALSDGSVFSNTKDWWWLIHVTLCLVLSFTTQQQ